MNSLHILQEKITDVPQHKQCSVVMYNTEKCMLKFSLMNQLVNNFMDGHPTSNIFIWGVRHKISVESLLQNKISQGETLT